MVTKDTSVADFIDVLEHGTPGPWPHGWTGWPNAAAAHAELARRQLAAPIPAYPGGCAGRGIVTCVSAKGGPVSGKELPQGHLPAAWCLVRELRRLGCTLPITFAHLGPWETDERVDELVRDRLGCAQIDLEAWQRETGRWRILAGWESKVAAVLACPYEEVLFLDSDNLPVRDPTYLFDEPTYRDVGAMFWPDLPPVFRKEWLPAACWQAAGLEPRLDVRAAESGQLLVNKRLCWPELQMTRWLNERSDLVFQVIYGDKDSWILGAHMAAAARQQRGEDGRPRYGMPKTPAGWNGGAILQHDAQGQRVFEHNAQNKFRLSHIPMPDKITFRAECESHLEELRGLWSGRLNEELAVPEDAEVTAALLGTRWIYHRDCDTTGRELRLLEDDRIGRGAARMEFGWKVQGGKLHVYSLDGYLTFKATRRDNGSWAGRWEGYERCKVTLAPVED